MEEYLVFYHNGKELCRYSLRGTFPGEREATIELTAQELGIPAAEITTRIERR